jgi:hypothetical protein
MKSIAEKWMRSIVERLEHLAVNAKVAPVLGLIPASFDKVESGGRQMKQCCIMYLDKKKQKNTPLKGVGRAKLIYQAGPEHIPFCLSFNPVLCCPAVKRTPPADLFHI